MDFEADYGPEPNDQEITLDAKVRVEWNNNDVIRVATNQVAEMIYEDIKPQVVKAILDAIDEQVNLAITALLDNDIQPTDRWGKPTGQSISIRALLQRDAEEWLTEKVDEYGRRQDSYGTKYPRIHWLFQEAIRGNKDHRGKTALASMVLKAVKETVGDVEAVVNATVREHVKKAMG